MKTLSRRAFLSMLALVPATGFALGRVRRRTSKQQPANMLQWSAAVNTVIGPYQSVVNTGRACTLPSIDENTSAWLELSERSFLNAVNDIDNRGLVDLRDSFRRQVQNDFKNSKTCELNSYILSQTEVSIYHWVAAIEAK